MPKFLARDGKELFYRDIGEGPCIFMIHGFGMHSGHWLPFAWLLSRNYRVILPDLRGFGRSHLVNFYDKCSVSNYAHDLHDLVEHLDVPRFKLIAISMGALTSLKYLEQHESEKVERYMHIDQSPTCMNSKDWNWGLFGAEHTVRVDRAKALIKELSPYIEANVSFEEIPQALRNQIHSELAEFFASALSKPIQKSIVRKLISRERISKLVLPTENWTAYMRCLHAYINESYDFRGVLNTSQVPIDILVGMKSEMYPAAGQLRMADLHSKSKVIAFPNSGHAPLIDQPIKLARELFKFAQH